MPSRTYRLVACLPFSFPGTDHIQLHDATLKHPTIFPLLAVVFQKVSQNRYHEITSRRLHAVAHVHPS